MKKFFIVVPLVIFMYAHCFAQGKKYSQSEFDHLYGLTGTWKMETKKGVLYEQWSKIDAQNLSGRSFKRNKTDTLILERTKIALTGGDVFYTAIVSGQNNEQPVPFKLVSNDNNQFVFENKEHDYPQRVIYKIVSQDSVHARIEGKMNGKEMSSDFFYTRVK